MFFGEKGDLNSEPSGLPYHITGTLKGLPPSPGSMFLDKKGRAGYEGDWGLSFTSTLDDMKWKLCFKPPVSF